MTKSSVKKGDIVPEQPIRIDDAVNEQTAAVIPIEEVPVVMPEAGISVVERAVLPIEPPPAAGMYQSIRRGKAADFQNGDVAPAEKKTVSPIGKSTTKPKRQPRAKPVAKVEPTELTADPNLTIPTPAEAEPALAEPAASLQNGDEVPVEEPSVSLIRKSATKPKRQPRAKPVVKVEPTELTAEPNLTIPTPAESEPALAESAANTPAAAAAMPLVAVPKPLFALGIEDGIIAIVAATADIEVIESLARFELEPLPRLISTSGSYFKVHRVESGSVFYAAYIPWPSAVAGPVQMGYTTASGKKQVMTVNCLPYRTLKPEVLLTLVKRFGPMLLPALDAVLSNEHPLRKALLKPIEVVPKKNIHPTLQGHFDGIIDGLAHGWAHDPAQAAKIFTIEIMHEGEVVAQGMADRYRDDLQANGIGDGCHHFRLRPSYELFDGREHTLAVNVVEVGQSLPSAAVSVTFAATQPRHFDWMPRSQTLQEAQQLGRSANVHNPRAEQALLQAFRKACLQQETWLLEDARAGYQRLAGILGLNALCHTKIAETWLLDNKLEPALEAYRAAIEIRPDYFWAHLGIGNVLQLQGKPLDAEAAYHKAIYFEPTSAMAKRRLAAVRSDALAARAVQLQNSGDNVGAINLLKIIILEKPDNETACANLDLLLRKLPMAKKSNKTSLPSYIENVTKACRLLDVVLDEAEKRLSIISVK